MKFGKFVLRLFCLSSIDGELSMTNKMSMSRFTVTGMSLYSTRPCCGLTFEIVRSRQPSRPMVVSPRNEAIVAALRIAHLQCLVRIEQVARQVEVRAVSNACFSAPVSYTH